MIQQRLKQYLCDYIVLHAMQEHCLQYIAQVVGGLIAEQAKKTKQKKVKIIKDTNIISVEPLCLDYHKKKSSKDGLKREVQLGTGFICTEII